MENDRKLYLLRFFLPRTAKTATMIAGIYFVTDRRRYTMLKLTFMMLLGFVMVFLAFGYVNGGGKKK